MSQVVNKRILTASDLQVIGQLLVEILGGESAARHVKPPRIWATLVRSLHLIDIL
jgi:hypothetical protein